MGPEGAGPPALLSGRRLDTADPLAARPLDLRHRQQQSRRLPQRCQCGTDEVAAYALAGLFAAMGGLVLTMSTGIGAPIPGPYLLASVAAVVLGGVTLGGGRGGLIGPIVAVFILRLVRSDLTLLAVDPNVATIIEGTIMVVVVMLGAYIATAEPRVMSEIATTAATLPLGRRLRRLMSDQPLIPLLVLLVMLIVDPPDSSARASSTSAGSPTPSSSPFRSPSWPAARR